VEIPSVSFRALSEGDLPLLQTWLSRPHLAEWWGGAPTLAEVEVEYGDLASRPIPHPGTHGPSAVTARPASATWARSTRPTVERCSRVRDRDDREAETSTPAPGTETTRDGEVEFEHVQMFKELD
jgi:hypothetical protein